MRLQIGASQSQAISKGKTIRSTVGFWGVAYSQTSQMCISPMNMVFFWHFNGWIMMNLICEKSTGNSCSTTCKSGGKPSNFSLTCRTWAVLVWWKVGQPVTDWDINIYIDMKSPAHSWESGKGWTLLRQSERACGGLWRTKRLRVRLLVSIQRNPGTSDHGWWFFLATTLSFLENSLKSWGVFGPKPCH